MDSSNLGQPRRPSVDDGSQTAIKNCQKAPPLTNLSTNLQFSNQLSTFSLSSNSKHKFNNSNFDQSDNINYNSNYLNNSNRFYLLNSSSSNWRQKPGTCLMFHAQESSHLPTPEAYSFGTTTARGHPRAPKISQSKQSFSPASVIVPLSNNMPSFCHSSSSHWRKKSPNKSIGPMSDLKRSPYGKEIFVESFQRPTNFNWQQKPSSTPKFQKKNQRAKPDKLSIKPSTGNTEPSHFQCSVFRPFQSSDFPPIKSSTDQNTPHQYIASLPEPGVTDSCSQILRNDYGAKVTTCLQQDSSAEVAQKNLPIYLDHSFEGTTDQGTTTNKEHNIPCQLHPSNLSQNLLYKQVLLYKTNTSFRQQQSYESETESTNLSSESSIDWDLEEQIDLIPEYIQNFVDSHFPFQDYYHFFHRGSLKFIDNTLIHSSNEPTTLQLISLQQHINTPYPIDVEQIQFIISGYLKVLFPDPSDSDSFLSDDKNLL